MARTGKIARLPLTIRNELNTRLQDGKCGRTLLKWLNELPQVKETLQEQFEGRDINDQNLSDWRQGGFRDWEKHQAALAVVAQFTEQAQELDEAARAMEITDRMAVVLGAELAQRTKTVLAETTELEQRWEQVQGLLRELNRLRQGDQRSARLRRERISWEEERERREDQEMEAELEAMRKRPANMFRAWFRLGTLARGFGGDEWGRTAAATTLEDELDLSPGSLGGIGGEAPPAGEARTEAVRRDPATGQPAGEAVAVEFQEVQGNSSLFKAAATAEPGQGEPVSAGTENQGEVPEDGGETPDCDESAEPGRRNGRTHRLTVKQSESK